jgi:hypothetical protein
MQPNVNYIIFQIASITPVFFPHFILLPDLIQNYVQIMCSFYYFITSFSVPVSFPPLMFLHLLSTSKLSYNPMFTLQCRSTAVSLLMKCYITSKYNIYIYIYIYI